MKFQKLISKYLLNDDIEIFYKLASLTFERALNILDLTEGFTPEELKKSYKIKAFELHPDRNKSPDAHNKFIELRIAYEMLSNQISPSSKAEEVPEVPIEEEVNTDLSYEEIAELREQMGREDFNKKFPGWERELKMEMGLDQWNEIFEGYNPNYEPPERDELWEALQDHANDQAYDLYTQLEENQQLGHYYDSESDLIDKYLDLNQDKWLMSLVKQKPHINLLKKYQKLLIDAFQKIKERHIDDFDLSIEDVLNYPEFNVIKSFLVKNINIVEIPDVLLAEKEFGRVVAVMLKYETDLDTALAVLQKYGDNKHFLDSLFESSVYFRNMTSPEIKEAIKSLPFDQKQKEIINRLLQ